jgi:hypothetical protein
MRGADNLRKDWENDDIFGQFFMIFKGFKDSRVQGFEGRFTLSL